MNEFKLLYKLLGRVDYKKFFLNLFTKNLLLKIFSVLGALTIFLYIERQNVVEKTFEIPLLAKNIPELLNISSKLPDAVTISVKGSKGAVSDVDLNQLKAYIPLNKAVKGVQTFFIRIKGLPGGVETIRILPQKVTVNLSTVIKRWVKVIPNIDEKGKPDDISFTTKIRPKTIVMYGSPEIFSEMTEVRTESIKVGSLRSDKELEVSLDAVYNSNPSLKFNREKKFKINITITKDSTNAIGGGEVVPVGNYKIKIGLKSSDGNSLTVQNFDDLYVTDVEFDVSDDQKDLFAPNMDLQFFIDITRINKKGEYTFTVKYENLPPYVKLISYYPRTVKVNIIPK